MSPVFAIKTKEGLTTQFREQLSATMEVLHWSFQWKLQILFHVWAVRESYVHLNWIDIHKIIIMDNGASILYRSRLTIRMPWVATSSWSRWNWGGQNFPPDGCLMMTLKVLRSQDFCLVCPGWQKIQTRLNNRGPRKDYPLFVRFCTQATYPMMYLCSRMDRYVVLFLAGINRITMIYFVLQSAR